MTGWSEIISAAKLLIDDVRWQKELEISAAQFFRAKSDFVKMALPRLNRPPGLLDYLQENLSDPEYDSAQWESTEASTEIETVVSLGMAGYELCTVSQRTQGGLYSVPYTDFTYDAESGSVTFGIQPESGLEYEIDFYTDGSVNDLSPTQMRLFALAIAVTWDERFDRTWLNMQPKIKDQSFETVNEANWTEKVSQRLVRNEQALSDELNKYEQDCAFRARFRDPAFRGRGLF